jgi:hypothetical protein
MPDRNRKPGSGSHEFEIAYYTKELGKTLQREMLRKQLARLSDRGQDNGVAPHADDAAPDVQAPPPREDRTDPSS